MKLKRLPAVVMLSLVAACAALAPTTLERGAVVETPAELRRQLAADLDARLISRDIRLRPVIGTWSRLTPAEQMVVSNFIELMPNASYIIGGTPNYILDIDRRNVPYPTIGPGVAGVDPRNVTYTVTLRTQSGRDLVSSATQTGLCLNSEAMNTMPTRCSLLEPFLLQRALEKL